MFRTEVQNARRVRARLPASCEVAVLGGGLAGMATAARLQAAGMSTLVVEAHGHAGGCAGYYRRRGFSFDVGATTMVDFEPGGVGAELLDGVGMAPVPGEALPGYVGWLPDRKVTLHRDTAAWRRERLLALGDTPRHRAFWSHLDQLAEVFWDASRAGVRLPMLRPADALHNLRVLGPRGLPLARHMNTTLGESLTRHGLRGDAPLAGLLAMLVEDTVHSSLDRAPLINAALGVTIRGAGLTRPQGGMRGFWRRFVAHYRAMGGRLHTACRAERVTGRDGAFEVHTGRGAVHARQVVSALPASTTARIVPALSSRLKPYLDRDAAELGGAIVVFLGVPEDEVAGQEFTHHQLMQDYRRPLGDGNNMFVSVSAPGDTDSAPAGHRAVMISTHTGLSGWEGLSADAYETRKRQIGERLVGLARRVHPSLGERALVWDVGTPRSYERFAFRPRGAVGGAHQTPGNANQNAIPHSLGVPGLWLVGDSTWPGLGTVACALGSRIVADDVLRAARRTAARR
ncbi:NAD(P)/FAD-dependent oxidoreductase [Actinomadura sp. NEAU-AAG7]|uniref:phytoene desaturase family protein n=1 Tax=Actinomadura sp. NEAU-AAG7 TaxID=2839640 RepID=UPI001BE4A1BC|nr:NAD(P)/FAD-dependent oxidoreductase [Actinomadura sp. NEAU-AAG7]MBT2213345.1 FAD-dependent oxidoreductase [Actinomadura sp. NEAU-AAG7]